MMQKLENVSSIIFDFDYTLVDSSNAIIECVSYALNILCLPVPDPDIIRRSIGLSSKDTLKMLTNVYDQRSAEKFRQLFTRKADEVMLEKTVILDNVKTVLSELDKIDLKLGIVSNKYRFRIDEFLKRENISGLIDIVVGFEDTPEPKPDPSGLIMAANKLGVSQKQTIYVGDSIVDAETASRIDMRFIATLTGVTPREDFLRYSPCLIINDLKELPDLLSGSSQ
jgi:phosphoglycolate phosphatase